MAFAHDDRSRLRRLAGGPEPVQPLGQEVAQRRGYDVQQSLEMRGVRRGAILCAQRFDD